MLLFDRMLLLGDLNISSTKSNDASALYIPDFCLVLQVESEIHTGKGLLDNVITSNNMCIKITTNSFLTTSGHSLICFSLKN